MLSTKYFACIHLFLGLQIQIRFIQENKKIINFVLRVERECNKDVSYKNIKIKKGTIVSVPAFALHYDEDYYPEPETFNPDR